MLRHLRRGPGSSAGHLVRVVIVALEGHSRFAHSGLFASRESVCPQWCRKCAIDSVAPCFQCFDLFIVPSASLNLHLKLLWAVFRASHLLYKSQSVHLTRFPSWQRRASVIHRFLSLFAEFSRPITKDSLNLKW